MNAIPSTAHSTAPALTNPAGGGAVPYVMTVGQTPCDVRVRTIALISEVLGFEQEMDGEIAELAGDSTDRQLIADVFDSRMIAPPRVTRRRQRPVSSRAMFYGAAGR